MSQTIWPFHHNGKTYNKPSVKGSTCFVNDVNLVQAIEESPPLFQHICDNKQHIEASLSHYISSISEPFVSNLPIGTLGRLKVAESEWQDEEKHKYVQLDLIHCANYNFSLLPFHNEENQYGFFFINIVESMTTQKVELYFNREQKPEYDEEHIWCNYDSIEVIYMPQTTHDNKDYQLGFQRMIISFLKRSNNLKLDELISLEHEQFRILICRLRGKVRHGKQGQIKSVQGIIQESLWDSAEEKLDEITPSDDDYSSNINITSYKLSRKLLFTKWKINTVYLIKVYDCYGKEMKLTRNIKEVELYSDASSYTEAVKALVLQIAKKYSKSKRIVDSINGFNGIRVSYNSGTRALIFKTNNYTSSVTVDIEKNKVNILNTSGRNGGW